MAQIIKAMKKANKTGRGDLEESSFPLKKLGRASQRAFLLLWGLSLAGRWDSQHMQKEQVEQNPARLLLTRGKSGARADTGGRLAES